MDSEVQTRFLGADSILFATAHRPWPLPRAQWLMTQTWNDLLFAHYAVEPELVRRLVPEILTVDLYQGAAWISVVPFWMTNVRPPGLPPMPGISRFAELNVRTYVTYHAFGDAQEKPGVYFFSLDASNLSAVWGARVFYRLPYWHASMKFGGTDEITYSSKRIHGPKASKGMPEWQGTYRPISVARTAKPGSLADFLTERYCLYSVNRSKLYRAEIHHLPWPLQQAEAEIEVDTMAEPLGIKFDRQPDIVQFSRSQKVLIFPPERLA